MGKYRLKIRKSKILENPIGRKLKTTNESIASILYKNDYFRVDIDVEISRAKLWQDLKMLILRSEASIIKLEIKGENTKIADHTFRQLSHIEFQFKQMDNQIYDLIRENEILNEKLIIYKNYYNK